VFENFETRIVRTSGATIHAVIGGSGPPLLLLHGSPQNHVMWHKLAPRLAEQFTVVAADLRGYGDSSKPPGGASRFPRGQERPSDTDLNHIHRRRVSAGACL